MKLRKIIFLGMFMGLLGGAGCTLGPEDSQSGIVGTSAPAASPFFLVDPHALSFADVGMRRPASLNAETGSPQWRLLSAQLSAETASDQ